ncbi:MAG: radical SAM protein [Deltaproteobacteria bacterium]|nr:radical SAM protein [Deltaproteobacteria bacterium]
MHRIDLKLGFACNNHCAFCVQGNKREEHGPRNAEQIEEDLKVGRQQGATELVLTGGEPTVHKNLLSVISLGRKLGYTNIQIQSNGRRFFYEDFCRAAIAAGATEFSPALHGSTAEVHEKLTEAPGSYEQVVTGIENLVRLGQPVVTNTVITTANYEQLPDLARLLVKLGVVQYQFAFVHILGSAQKNQQWLVPRKSDIMPYVREGLDVGRAAGVRCMTEAIPFCLMEGYEEHVAEQIIPKTLIYDADHTIDDYGQYRMDQGKVRGPPCEGCAYLDRCEGPWREYPELFGWDEFKPRDSVAE